MFRLRAAVASCWVRALMRCDASSATDFTPVERETALEKPVFDELLQFPPMPPPNHAMPALPPELEDLLNWNACESPCCSSRAIAFASSLIERFWSVVEERVSA